MWTYQYPGAFYLGLNLGEVDINLAARTVTARVLNADGQPVLERTWGLDDINLSKLNAPLRGHHGPLGSSSNFSFDSNRPTSAARSSTVAEPSVLCTPHRGKAHPAAQAVGFALALLVFLLPLAALALQLAALPGALRTLQSWAAQPCTPGSEQLGAVPTTFRAELCAWAAQRKPGLKLRKRLRAWALQKGPGSKLRKLRKKLQGPETNLRKLAGTREVVKLRGGLRKALEKASSARGRISAGL